MTILSVIGLALHERPEDIARLLGVPANASDQAVAERIADWPAKARKAMVEGDRARRFRPALDDAEGDEP